MKLKFFLIDLHILPINAYKRSFIRLFCPTCEKFTGIRGNLWTCANHTIMQPISDKENNKISVYCSGYRESEDKIKKL